MAIRREKPAAFWSSPLVTRAGAGTLGIVLAVFGTTLSGIPVRGGAGIRDAEAAQPVPEGDEETASLVVTQMGDMYYLAPTRIPGRAPGDDAAGPFYRTARPSPARV
jgi:hypothetical protein